MKRLLAISHRIATIFAVAGLFVLMLNVAATVIDLVGRTLFAAPLDRLTDLSALAYILAASCCVPLATAKRCHITIRPFEGRLGPRAYAAVEALASLLLLAVWVVLAWQLWLHASEVSATGQTLSQWRDVAVAPFWYFVAVALSFNAGLEALNFSQLMVGALGKGGAPTPTAPADAPNLL